MPETTDKGEKAMPQLANLARRINKELLYPPKKPTDTTLADEVYIDSLLIGIPKDGGLLTAEQLNRLEWQEIINNRLLSERRRNLAAVKELVENAETLANCLSAYEYTVEQAENAAKRIGWIRTQHAQARHARFEEEKKLNPKSLEERIAELERQLSEKG